MAHSFSTVSYSPDMNINVADPNLLGAGCSLSAKSEENFSD